MSHRYEVEVASTAPHEIHLDVTGEVDIETAPLLLDSILCAGLACGAGDRVVVDLRRVAFLDSSGLAAFVEAHRRLAQQEQVLVLADPTQLVARVLQLSGLDQLVSIERTAAPGAA